MSTKIRLFWQFIARHKYSVTILLFLMWMTFIDDNSFLVNFQRHSEEQALQEKIADYQKQYQIYSNQVQQLENDPAAIEKKAREQYYMQRADEDVFIIQYTSGNGAAAQP